VPVEIPAAPADQNDPSFRATLSIEWTRRPNYATVPQSGLNKLLSTIELLGRVHKTAIAVLRDGDQYAADPTSNSYRAA
jgi:hypothetical protein